MKKDCIFCKMSAGEISVEKIYENDNFFSVKDINPKVDGHSIVICKKHFETSLDIPSSLGLELIDCIKNTYIKLSKNLECEGFNLVGNNFEAAGQEIKHVHFHILPRRKGDGFKVI